MIRVVQDTSTTSKKILVIDDDPSVLDLVGVWLRAIGATGVLAETAQQGIDKTSTCLAAAVLLDLSLPDIHGLDVLQKLKARDPETPVIIMTADQQAQSVVSAMKLGAYDYLTKPLEKTRLLTTVERALDRGQLQDRLSRLEREARAPSYPGMVGRSPVMRAMFSQLDRVATRDITVLIHGESGTGKELIARGLHDRSPRKQGPLVTLNCAAVPETLQESELFGHERGAFTGADQQRKGRFELANGGTLFLDEVAELSASLQAKLLRVLQEKHFHRVGGTELIPSDFRVIAASHKSLKAEVDAGRFRADLYYRLAVFEVDVPALRERGDDIRLLAERFLLELADPGVDGPVSLSDAAEEALRRHPWPGNVRELQNAMHRALVLTRGPYVEVSDLPTSLQGPAAAEPELDAPRIPVPGKTEELHSEQAILTLDEIERQAILDAIARTGGNLSEVVRQLGLGRTTLYRKLKKYGIPR